AFDAYATVTEVEYPQAREWSSRSRRGAGDRCRRVDVLGREVLMLAQRRRAEAIPHAFVIEREESVGHLSGDPGCELGGAEPAARHEVLGTHHDAPLHHIID